MGNTIIKQGLHTTISGSSFNFGDVRIMFISAPCPSTSQIDIAINGFAKTPFTVIPFCTQPGFGASMTVSVVRITKDYITLYQYNNANVAANIGAIVIGNSQ